MAETNALGYTRRASEPYALPAAPAERPPCKMKMSIPHKIRGKRNNRIARVWCECQAQLNDQDRRPDAPVPWRFWGWDWLAEIDLVDDSAVDVWREHCAEVAAAAA